VESVTVPVKPLMLERLIVLVPDDPWGIERDDGEEEML
jgi:hypothetical protein